MTPCENIPGSVRNTSSISVASGFSAAMKSSVRSAGLLSQNTTAWFFDMRSLISARLPTHLRKLSMPSFLSPDTAIHPPGSTRAKSSANHASLRPRCFPSRSSPPEKRCSSPTSDANLGTALKPSFSSASQSGRQGCRKVSACFHSSSRCRSAERPQARKDCPSSGISRMP